MAHDACHDDPRTLAQRRADALGALAAGADRLACGCGSTDCPTGTDPDPRAAAVVIHVVAEAATLDAAPDQHTSGERPARPITTDMTLAEALAPDPEPDVPAFPTPPAAHLIGGATLPASMVAELIRGGAKVRPVRHPGDAAPAPGYRPSAALERFIRCRDMTCRFPGCDHPAEFADIDHTIPYPWGPTHASNLKCLCKKHHLLKTFWTGWRDEQLPDGTVIWTSPSGQKYLTRPGSRLLFPALCLPHRRNTHRPNRILAIRRSRHHDAHPPPHPRTRPRPPHRRRTRPQRRPRRRTQPTTALLAVDNPEERVEILGGHPRIDVPQGLRVEPHSRGNAMILSAENKSVPAPSQVQGRAHQRDGCRPRAQLRTAQRKNLTPASSSDFKAIANNANGDFRVEERTHPERASEQEGKQSVPAENQPVHPVPHGRGRDVKTRVQREGQAKHRCHSPVDKQDCERLHVHSWGGRHETAGSGCFCTDGRPDNAGIEGRPRLSETPVLG
jgi:hypothetical protein